MSSRDLREPFDNLHFLDIGGGRIFRQNSIPRGFGFHWSELVCVSVCEKEFFLHPVIASEACTIGSKADYSNIMDANRAGWKILSVP